MSLKDKLIKIENYTGIYFKNDKALFDCSIVTTSELQKKVKPPYTIVLKFYEGKKLKLEQIHIADARHTMKRVCDELQAKRDTVQIEKSFKSIRPIKMTFKELFDEVDNETIVSPKWKYVRKTYVNKHLVVLFDKPIDEIEVGYLQTLYNEILRSVEKPRTAHTAKQILSAVFNYAIKRKYIKDNPAKDIEIQKYDNQVYFALSDEKALKLYDVIQNISPVNKAIFAFLINGRRRGETLKMRWEYIDFENRIYATPDTITKADKSFSYPLTEDIAIALQELGTQTSGYIFPSEQGEHRKDIRTIWEKIKKTVGTEKMRLHDMRHLIGYRASKAQLPLHIISKTLGHRSIQTTMRYANVDTDMVADLLSVVKNISNSDKK